MKQINKLMLLAFLAFAIVSCKKHNNDDDVVPVNLTVKLSFDTDNSAYGFTFEKATVKITNLTNNQSYSAKATADGTATFTSVPPGNYDVATTLPIAPADYNAKAGTNVQDTIIYNGTLNKQSVVSNGQLAITLKTGRVGDFVIKQIYYAGSSASNGALYRDQFIEIYNNSTETLYADSLYIGEIMGLNTAITSVDQSKGFTTPSGQYDWTKSVGMNNANANTNYLYAKTLFMIAGTGKQYPVLPGKSIIIAATALNHKAPYVGTDGKSVTVKDPTLTIDLSAADFEVYLGNYAGINPLPSDIDNPAVPNLTVISNNGNRDLILDNPGREGIMIFKSKVNPTTWSKYATPDVTQVVSATNLYIQVPASTIVDAVGINSSITASRVARRIPDALDAGDTFVPAGAYTSQSVVRKTSKTINGRIVLKDTNNSTNDFGYLPLADPSKGASSFVN